jgi:hypothetical protein
MFNITEFFTKGAKNTIQVKSNSGFSYTGSWKQIYGTTLVERWYLGDFNSADYTISIDLNTDHKEIVKCLVTGTINDAKLVVYARNYTNIELVNFSAVVNESYIELYVSPTTSKAEGAKFFYTANYFANQTPLNV